MYRQVLTRAESDVNFLAASIVPGVKIRLAACQQIAGNFTEAETLINEVLKLNPKALDAQLEAAKLYQAWGAKDPTKFNLAINGNTASGFWGWGQLAIRLQLLAQQGGEKKDEYLEQLFESRYNTSLCRKLYANSLPGEAAKLEREKSEFELVAFSRVTPQLVESAYWEKYNKLYQDLLKDQNKAMTSLKKPAKVAAVSKTIPAKPQTEKTTSQRPVPVVQTAAPEAKPDNTTSYLVTGVLCLLGLGMIGFIIFSGGSAKKKPVYTASSPFTDVNVSDLSSKPVKKPITKSIDENPPIESAAVGVKRKRPPEPPSS
jgi:hypothetical protein